MCLLQETVFWDNGSVTQLPIQHLTQNRHEDQRAACILVSCQLMSSTLVEIQYHSHVYLQAQWSPAPQQQQQQQWTPASSTQQQVSLKLYTALPSHQHSTTLTDWRFRTALMGGACGCCSGLPLHPGNGCLLAAMASSSSSSTLLLLSSSRYK